MGASVLATDVAVEKGQAIVEELTAAGATAHFLEHDVTDEAQWEAAVATAIEKLGGLNGVINNAAIVPMNYLAELEVEEYNRVLNVNVTGSMLGCKHGFRAMQPGALPAKAARSSICLLLWVWPAQLPWPPITLPKVLCAC